MTAGYLKRAALALAVAAQRPDGTYPDDAVARAAAAAGVTPRQVRRWLKAEAKHLAAGVGGIRDVPDPAPRKAWQVTPQVLAVVAAAPKLKRAWQELCATDPSTPSYPAFTAALRNHDDNGIARAVKGGGARTLIGSRMYLKVEVAARNRRWELDSQEVPVFVLPAKGTKPVKLHQTTALDAKTRMVMATVFTPGPPRAEEVAACIARGVLGRTYLLDDQEVWVGGIPDEIVWDNAKSNLSDLVTELVVSLATLGTAVTPYAGWEKGKIESWQGISQDECYSSMPAYTEGPASFTGTKYWGDHTSGNQLFSEMLLIAQGERWAFEEYNATRIHGQLGTTPLRAWAADNTQLRLATQEQLMPAMLTTKHARTVNKNGIRLHGVDYVAAELNRLVGRKVAVRYLPNLEFERLFIEVFDGPRWVCTAYPSHTLTANQRAALLAERRRQYEVVRTAEQEGARMRRARADRTKATNGAQTTYGQTAAEFAVDELAANVDELLDDITDPTDEAPIASAPQPDATLPTGDEEPFYADVAGVTEPDIDDLAADPSALFDDEEDLP
ncbi:Mu transposase C-terminal domain-containing protein [Blastococcus sp. PRF04-17]|uniref:Mu transposase C-terminal domain-containing protein n=1 Tax=Blastococcus sp. PRF04-17 TaxID=2933797 RepID=UPI001FF6B90D|nr:Mu transposase C-terminal domain-containing protein [Blastococcus sp. PRF04-17]UOY01644.1 Mu transposase C-terminal domain-containing protein [Blastococcus sp. PRF04-17]